MEEGRTVWVVRWESRERDSSGVIDVFSRKPTEEELKDYEKLGNVHSAWVEDYELKD